LLLLRCNPIIIDKTGTASKFVDVQTKRIKVSEENKKVFLPKEKMCV
jgi:hypothetical protein